MAYYRRGTEGRMTCGITEDLKGDMKDGKRKTV